MNNNKYMMSFNQSFPTSNTKTQDSGEKSQVVIDPTDSDVLFGRGKGCMNRNGNKRFRMIVNLHREQYALTPRHDKMDVVYKVMNIIEYMGGRFLQRDNSTKAFIEVSEKPAFEKVSHALRETKSCKSQSFTSEVNQPQEELILRQQQIFIDLLSSDIQNLQLAEEEEEGEEEEGEGEETNTTHGEDDAPIRVRGGGGIMLSQEQTDILTLLRQLQGEHSQQQGEGEISQGGDVLLLQEQADIAALLLHLGLLREDGPPNFDDHIPAMPMQTFQTCCS